MSHGQRSCWLNVDGDGIEDKEACAVRHGFKVEDVPHLQFIRWMTASEAEVAPKPAWDEVSEPGPPAEPEGPNIEEQQAALEARQAAAAARRETEERYHRAVEVRRREETAEKLADHARRYKQRGV